MQLRYSFRVYPTASQCSSLARAFGCARVVFNDALRVREEARAAGLPFVTAADLSKRLTAAKKTPDRAWLGEVSSVVLQQSLRDLETSYRNFFDGLKGKRPKMGAPRFKSRRDNRQSIRFTANAGWKITMGGKLRLPKVGDVSVKWSRALPSTPSTVTVVKDASGRYFASFVVETDPAADLLPQRTGAVGIDLGLTRFAILSDGTKIDSPKFLRRAEKKLKRAQQSLSRKAKGSSNRDKARLKVARQHARVADARREFHHQLSTWIHRAVFGECGSVIFGADSAVLLLVGMGDCRVAVPVAGSPWSLVVGGRVGSSVRFAVGGRRLSTDRRTPPASASAREGARSGSGLRWPTAPGR
nr:transposase [Streptomyces sp. 846.5]